MSKRWYPIIDYEKCVGCGQCYGKCKKDVYKMEKGEKTMVINPENCTEGCSGCKNICPVGAIEYIDTRKQTNNETKSNIGDSCSCSCKNMNN